MEHIGFVYVVEAGRTHVKIGVSKDPFRRVVRECNLVPSSRSCVYQCEKGTEFTVEAYLHLICRAYKTPAPNYVTTGRSEFFTSEAYQIAYDALSANKGDFGISGPYAFPWYVGEPLEALSVHLARAKDWQIPVVMELKEELGAFCPL